MVDTLQTSQFPNTANPAEAGLSSHDGQEKQGLAPPVLLQYWQIVFLCWPPREGARVIGGLASRQC